MVSFSARSPNPTQLGSLAGVMWLGLLVLAACFYFYDGLDALLLAWQKPEYSHGPLIPVLSLFLFLRQLKEVPVNTGPVSDRWTGVWVVALSVAFAAIGKLSNIADVVAYATIIFTGGVLLISFGWKVGKQMWPPILHLIYMLPLPDTLYYKFSIWLQFISSNLGVWLLKLISVPVFLDGNIIDLGVYKLHVAEACSGLRYLFPILSFSYIFAVLYRGPMWHKAVLLISAAPITVLMNSVRIAVAGYIVNTYGIEWVEGFTHFFEGWVIFLICIALMFFLAWLMVFVNPDYDNVVDALDLETDGLMGEAKRIFLVQPSRAIITATAIMAAAALAWQAVPERGGQEITRRDFITFPRELGEWQQHGPRATLSAPTLKSLQADDYHQIDLVKPNSGEPTVGLFMAWYADQSQGGVHSPEICLPSSGWEIAWLERTDITEIMGSTRPFHINRAIIQKGEVRMMVFYWFEQKGRRLAWDFGAKLWLMYDGIRTGRTDGAMLRLTTLIPPGESDAEAEARLMEVLPQVVNTIPAYIPNE